MESLDWIIIGAFREERQEKKHTNYSEKNLVKKEHEYFSC